MSSLSPEEQKRALRAHMTAQRGLLEPEEAARRGKSAQGRLAASPCWANARTVAVYMPIRNETDTGILRARARAEGKRVLLPRCVAGRRGELELVACDDATELAPGAYGILEPLPSLPAIELDDPEQSPQLLIVPCLAVDRQGCRLGYGGGYYDRLLCRPALRTAVFVALIYQMQFVVSLPAESRDVRVHGVCTEEGMLWL